MSVKAIAPKTPHFPKEWRSTKLAATTTAGAQTVRAMIGYSIGPRWTMQIKNDASSAGVATLTLGKRTFSVPVAKGQSAFATANRFQKQFKAAGFYTQLIGQRPLTPQQAQEAGAKIFEKQRELQAPGLSAADQQRLKLDIEILKSKLSNTGFVDLSFTTEH